MPQKPLSEYEVDIPAVAELLANDSTMADFFNALTPGYQREWRALSSAPKRKQPSNATSNK